MTTRPSRDPGYALRIYWQANERPDEVSGYQSLDAVMGAGNRYARGESGLHAGPPDLMEVVLEGTVIYRWTPGMGWVEVIED